VKFVIADSFQHDQGGGDDERTRPQKQNGGLPIYQMQAQCQPQAGASLPDTMPIPIPTNIPAFT
jgi:hypothetical protein